MFYKQYLAIAHTVIEAEEIFIKLEANLQIL